jgi:hypothetical protein
VSRIEQETDAAPISAARRGRSLDPKVIPSAGGTTVRALKDAMQELVGMDVVATALASLPAEVREAFEPVTPMTWVPLDAIYTSVARVAEVAGRSFDDLMDEAVQRAGEKTLRTAWRMLLRVTADRALIRRAPILYAKWRNIGRLETVSTDHGKAELFLTEWPGMSERNIRSLGITIENVLRLAGRKQIKVQWQATPDGAKYAVVWQA